MALTGKVAIVTGGNSGIGKAIVLALADEGATIVIDYVADEQAEEDLERQVAALGDRVLGVEADVSKVDELQRLIEATVNAFGRLDIMVNNAGIETRSSILDTTEDQYDKVMAVNLKSAFFGTQLAAKQMIAQGGGGPGVVPLPQPGQPPVEVGPVEVRGQGQADVVGRLGPGVLAEAGVAVGQGEPRPEPLRLPLDRPAGQRQGFLEPARGG